MKINRITTNYLFTYYFCHSFVLKYNMSKINRYNNTHLSFDLITFFFSLNLWFDFFVPNFFFNLFFCVLFIGATCNESITCFQESLINITPSFLSQNWCQISVRILCVLPSTRNPQCYDLSFNIVNFWQI